MDDVNKFSDRIFLEILQNFNKLYKREPVVQKYKEKGYKEALYPTNNPTWYFEYKVNENNEFEIFEALTHSQMHETYILDKANELLAG